VGHAIPGLSDGSITGIDAVTTNNVYAIGAGWTSATGPYAARWNGLRWSSLPTIPSAIGYSALDADASGTWIAATTSGDAVLARWNGSAWSTQPTNAKRITRIRERTPNDVWTIGLTADGGTLTSHWNGTTWQEVPGPELVNVLPVAENDVWGINRAYEIVHWDGSQWSPAATPDKAEFPGDLVLDGDGGVWAARNNTHGRNADLLHYSGGVWKIEATGRTNAWIPRLAAIPNTATVLAFVRNDNVTYEMVTNG
jgi:hypothetical protein